MNTKKNHPKTGKKDGDGEDEYYGFESIYPEHDGEEKEVEIPDGAPNPEELLFQANRQANRVELFIKIASAIIDNKRMQEHLANRQRNFFEAFFTYDVTKRVKEENDTAEAAIEKSPQLFPAMEIILLEYLMIGSFSGMKDVSLNKLKVSIKLEQKQVNIANCYGVKARQTIATRQDNYENWLKSISEVVAV